MCHSCEIILLCITDIILPHINKNINKQKVTFRARKATYTLQILKSLICVTYQHLLELFYSLIGNTDAINLSDLISYMQSP